MNNEKDIIKVGNKNYYFMLIISAIVCILLSALVSINNNRYARVVVLCLSIFNVIYFWVYRYHLSIDAEYIDLWYADLGKMNWYNELPFYPCNVVVMFTPIAIYTMYRPLLSYLAVLSFLGPGLAILFPTKGFEKYSYKKARVRGYYITHIISMMNLPLFIFGNILKPMYSDILPLLITFFLVLVFVHILNTYLIKSKKNLQANYYYTNDPQGLPVLSHIYKIIPVKGLYMFLMAPFFVFIYVVYIIIF